MESTGSRDKRGGPTKNTVPDSGSDVTITNTRVKESLEWLRTSVSRINYLPLRTICEKVLNDTRFETGYGSAVNSSHGNPHHAYPGGLVVHTREVVEGALDMGNKWSEIYKPQPAQEILIAAGIFHDYMKIYDYSAEGVGTSYRQLIRHPSGSFHEFMRLVEDWDREHPVQPFDSRLAMKIAHCIISHHGRKEWGAAVEPQTVEAQILHYADMLSMQYGVGR